MAFWTGLRIETIGGFALPLVLSLPLTVFWLLLSMNAFNLIDGLDGLCAGMGFAGNRRASCSRMDPGQCPPPASDASVDRSSAGLSVL